MDKNSVSIRLEKANASDAKQLYTWFKSLDEIQYWGGPSMEYPLDLEAFQQKLKMDQLPSFKLVDNDQQILAFGQSYCRVGRNHFGRLAVSPKQRGKGLGRLLLSELMKVAPQAIQGLGYSLFVMDDNSVAKTLYLSMGYTVAKYPEPLDTGLASFMYMIRDPL